uniref:Ribonuclease H-like domain-containing protein n=1 Tax=Tanacetum cinerariifolium TaxID=118510 RepID=A0A6L2MBM6_TANCI|nr:ribonuclease H-like domain-containing protein [Tanacetum cinerariifolium]
MASLTFADTHSMVAYLSKSDASVVFEQILDFLNAQVIQYALMVNPTIYVFCIKQFWATASIKKANNIVKLQALIDGKKVVVTEDVIRQDLRLNDADGVDAKRTALNEFSCSMASDVICFATEVADMDAELQGRITQEDVSAATKVANAVEPTVFDDKEENIDWNVVAEQIQEKNLDNIRKYQSLKRKPVSIAQARRNMIIYLKNMAGYKMEHFIETPTNDPKEISEKDVHNMLEIVPVSEFKVEALQVKLVKDKFSSAVPNVDKEKSLWIELKRHEMFMLTEKNYPLSNGVMTLMLSEKLQVEEDSDMARDLVMKIFMEANKPKSKKNVIVGGPENHLPMLEKTWYSSWESHMLLYIKGKEHGKLIYDPVINGPFKYGIVTVPRTQTTHATVRDRTYDELIDAKKIREAYDIKATNIVLQGLPQYIYNLPEWSRFVMDVKLAKDFHNNNFDHLYGYLRQNEAHANEVRQLRQRYPNPLTLNCQEEGHMARHCNKPKRPRNSAWFKEKMLHAEALESGVSLDEEHMAFLADNEDTFTRHQASQELVI